MNSLNEITKKLLFISEQICEIYEDLYNLTMKNQEKSKKYDDDIEFFENYIIQESTLLDNANQEELLNSLKSLSEYGYDDVAINRCYETIRYYFLNRYPNDKDMIDAIEGPDITEIFFITKEDKEDYENEDDEIEENYDDEDEKDNEEGNEEINNLLKNFPMIEFEYEDEEEVSSYIDYTVLRTKINVIKKMYQHIKNTEANNKVDSKYKKELLKQLKGFKCDFFFQNRDTEQLGIKCHFDVSKLPNLPELDENVASICYNECLDILDELYLMPNEEREAYTILENLFNMLCFDEYIKSLSPEQIDKLIEICHRIEASMSNSFFGNIGLQKLVRKKKN